MLKLVDPRPDFSKIRRYYACTADVYRRWGGGSGAMHSGYYEDSDTSGDHVASLKRLTTELIRYAGISPGWRVLEAGCGTGSVLCEIGKKCGVNGEAWGIDIVPRHLEIAQECIAKDNLANTHVSLRSYENTGFDDGSFDCVVFCESLCHAQDKEKVLNEMRRILRADGVIAIADSFIKSGLAIDGRDSLKILEFGWVEKVISAESMRELLENIGFFNVRHVNLTRNILPSIKIMADKAIRHIDDSDKQDKIMQNHITATIAYHQLMSEGKTSFLFVRAERG